MFDKINLFYFSIFIITLSVSIIAITMANPSWALKLNHKNKLVYSWPIILSFSFGVASFFLIIGVLLIKRNKTKKIVSPELEYDPN